MADNDIGAGVAIAGMAIGIGLLLGGSSQDVRVEGVTGDDLSSAVIRCTPALATFEQRLACHQAVYGGR